MKWQQALLTILVALIGATPPTIAIILSNEKTQEKVDGATHELIAEKVKAATAQATLTEKKAERDRQGEEAIAVEKQRAPPAPAKH